MYVKLSGLVPLELKVKNLLSNKTDFLNNKNMKYFISKIASKIYLRSLIYIFVQSLYTKARFYEAVYNDLINYALCNRIRIELLECLFYQFILDILEI